MRNMDRQKGDWAVLFVWDVGTGVMPAKVLTVAFWHGLVGLFCALGRKLCHHICRGSNREVFETAHYR